MARSHRPVHQHYRPERSFPDAIVAILSFGGIAALIGSVIAMKLWYG